MTIQLAQPNPIAAMPGYEVDGEPSLAAFDALRVGSPAPYWLFRGVAAAWRLDPADVDLRLITVSENATFQLAVGGRAVGAVRVPQPGYVGGPGAVASKIAWVGALRRSVPEVRVLEPGPRPEAPMRWW
ncbi:MAG: hypothetical protein LBO20_11370 [Bifidobacteriaceae bacterium]|nr:hypothetical protein [Bifidobacteriaceae bacterium]